MIELLLPCPFCGGKAEMHHTEAYSDDYGYVPDSWWVSCENISRCRMIVQTCVSQSKEKAIKVWNTRKSVV